MLEKPNIPDELIISNVQAEYRLHVTQLTFLPIGADMGSVVYRLVAEDGTVYFLKLRKGFDEIVVTVPLFLKSQGVQEIIAPFETKSNRGWADFDEYKMILYPFLDGKNGFQVELSDDHKRRFGSALKAIHSAQIPAELKRHIPKEGFSPQWRERVRSIQQQVEEMSFPAPWAAKLAEFIKSNETEISRIIQRAEELASELRSEPLDLVLCHTDVHGGNILICRDRQLPVPTDEFYIVDWDAPLLAPKERDLMFIGGGIDTIWESKQDEALFYEGYGETDIDFAVMAFYRYERVIEDLAAYADQLFLTDKGGADREEAYRRFIGNFDPGETIAIADETYKLI